MLSRAPHSFAPLLLLFLGVTLCSVQGAPEKSSARRLHDKTVGLTLANGTEEPISPALPAEIGHSEPPAVRGMKKKKKMRTLRSL